MHAKKPLPFLPEKGGVMRKIAVCLLVLLVLAAFALTPGKVVFQNAYPEFGEESSYNLKDTFTYGVDTEIPSRCYYGGHTFAQWPAYALGKHPGTNFDTCLHSLFLEFDPTSGWEGTTSWYQKVDATKEYDQCGGYDILPPEDWRTDSRGVAQDIGYYAGLGARGTHTVTYKVDIKLVGDWNPWTEEYERVEYVTISEGSFKWIVP